jgi:hypothetical protein
VPGFMECATALRISNSAGSRLLRRLNARHRESSLLAFPATVGAAAHLRCRPCVFDCSGVYSRVCGGFRPPAALLLGYLAVIDFVIIRRRRTRLPGWGNLPQRDFLDVWAFTSTTWAFLVHLTWWGHIRSDVELH